MFSDDITGIGLQEEEKEIVLERRRFAKLCYETTNYSKKKRGKHYPNESFFKELEKSVNWKEREVKTK